MLLHLPPWPEWLDWDAKKRTAWKRDRKIHALVFRAFPEKYRYTNREAWEKRKARKVTKKLSTYESKERQNRKRRERWACDEEYRKKRITQKTEWARKNKARFRANWNAWYQRVKDTKRGQQLESRIRCRPLYGLASTLAAFESGAIGIDELNRRYDAALARVNAQSERRLANNAGSKQIVSETNGGSGQRASQVNEDEARHSESFAQDIEGHQ